MVIDRGGVIAEGTASELKARLGSTVIELGFGDAAQARRAGGVVAHFGVRPPDVDGSLVHLEVADGARLLVEALRALDQNGLVPETLSVREPSLDDVFLTLTGHPAEPVEPDPDIAARGAA